MADIFSMLSGGVLDILNTLFNPLLALDPNPQNPALTVLVIAFIVSLITTVANKYLVDQDKVNENQKKSRELSSRMREAQKKGDGKELAKLQAEQTEMLKNQNAVMMESFKPMLVTFVPIFLEMWASSQMMIVTSSRQCNSPKNAVSRALASLIMERSRANSG